MRLAAFYNDSHTRSILDLGIKKQAAPGVDGTTWEQYGVELDTKLRELHNRLRQGACRAKPSRRVYIPKADGRRRPIGVAALEDKIVQKAVVEVMNAVYEETSLASRMDSDQGATSTKRWTR